MANAKASPYTLRRGRTQPFRRTVKGPKKGESLQLVFEPGSDVALSEAEVSQLADLIESGMIVPADRDEKGRLRMPRELAELQANCEELQAKVDELTAANSELSNENSELQAKVDELTAKAAKEPKD